MLTNSYPCPYSPSPVLHFPYDSANHSGCEDTTGHIVEVCTSHLSCANESSGRSFGQKQAGCDVVGIVGSVCMCGIPLVNGFIDMVSPEQFLYYLIIMLMTVKHGNENQFTGGVKPSHCYVDFACK